MRFHFHFLFRHTQADDIRLRMILATAARIIYDDFLCGGAGIALSFATLFLK